MTIEDRAYTWSLSTLTGPKKLVHLELELPTSEKMTIHLANELKSTIEKAAHQFEFETVLFSGKSFRFETSNSISHVDADRITFDIVHENSIKSSVFDEIKMKLEAKRLIDAGECQSEMKIMLAVPQFGESFEGLAKFEHGIDSFSAAAEYKRGPAVFSVESAGKMVMADTKSNIQGHVQVKIPSYEQVKFSTSSVADYSSPMDFQVRIQFLTSSN